MQKTFNFPSLTRNGIAYQWTVGNHDIENGFYGAPGAYIDSHANEYQTFGDGMIQHSRLWAVASAHFQDWCASLAAYLNDNHGQIKSVAFDLDPRTNSWSRRKIEFFQKLKYDENKRVFYNPETLKKSSSDSKRHDDRWHEVPSWADGTFEAVFKLMTQSFYGAAKRFALFEHVRAVMDCPWTSDTDFENLLGFSRVKYTRQAWDVLESMIKSYQYADHAKVQLDCLRHNMGLNAVEAAADNR